MLENIRKQAEKFKDTEWIYTEGNQQNPVNVEYVECYLHLQQNIVKGEIGTDTRRHLALETMNTRYPPDQWLHIFTDGCQMDRYINAGAGIYCELFSCYMLLV